MPAVNSELHFCERYIDGVITKLLKMAKPNFGFGHFQKFCNNSSCSFTMKQLYTDMLFKEMR